MKIQRAVIIHDFEKIWEKTLKMDAFNPDYSGGEVELISSELHYFCSEAISYKYEASLVSPEGKQFEVSGSGAVHYYSGIEGGNKNSKYPVLSDGVGIIEDFISSCHSNEFVHIDDMVDAAFYDVPNATYQNQDLGMVVALKLEDQVLHQNIPREYLRKFPHSFMNKEWKIKFNFSELNPTLCFVPAYFTRIVISGVEREIWIQAWRPVSHDLEMAIPPFVEKKTTGGFFKRLFGG